MYKRILCYKIHQGDFKKYFFKFKKFEFEFINVLKPWSTQSRVDFQWEGLFFKNT